MEPVAVLLPRLLLVDLVPVGLRQPQEPPNGAQVLPQRAVLRAWALLPPEQLAQPTLGGGETWRRGSVARRRYYRGCPVISAGFVRGFLAD